MTVVSDQFVAALVERGLPRREAKWLVDEFAPGGDHAAERAVHLAADRRLAGEPLQYVLGHWPFRELDLDVDPRVLIPRPETEELVDHALAALALTGATTPCVVDLGCGSGAIGLSLLWELSRRGIVASLLAVDESVDALAVARRNALKHGLTNVTFVHSNWYDELDPSFQGRVDLIVANPPYVADVEVPDLDPVLSYEPQSALVAPDVQPGDGLADLAEILAGAPTWLHADGALVMEHGATQGSALITRATEAGFMQVRDHHDLAGRPRVLVAQGMGL